MYTNLNATKDLFIVLLIIVISYISFELMLAKDLLYTHQKALINHADRIKTLENSNMKIFEPLMYSKEKKGNQ